MSATNLEVNKSLQKSMKITGEIVLIETTGRRDPWVKKQTEKDFFLAFKITGIDSHEITTCASAFEALKHHLPSISCDGEELKDLFQSPTLPPNADDILHLTLGNFPDFRFGRNVANDIDPDRIAAAEELHGTKITFELASDAFQLVSTSEFSSLLNTTAQVVQAKTVGFKRDTVISLLPSEEVQSQMQKMSRSVFGPEFVLWNAQQEPIPYNVTIAQTDKLNPKLAQAHAKSVEMEVTATSPGFGV
jgi:hypothetical protein